MTSKLDRYKKAQASVHRMLDPQDTEFKNCQRRVKDIQRSYLKLPKICTLKLYENKALREQEKSRIQKENQILHRKLSEIEMEKRHNIKLMT